MRNILQKLLIAGVVLSLNCEPIMAYAMPEPAPAAQTAKQKAAQKKKKEAEKRKKEAEKRKKAKAKVKAQRDKQKEAEAKKRKKAAAERAKIAVAKAEAKAKKEAEAKAKEEKAIRDYEKYQESLINPPTEPISYFNIGLRLGYAGLMDQINGAYMGAGTLNQSNVLQQLKGGPGAGLDFTYNLEYGHFLFETGIDVRFLNSTSAYGFTVTRPESTYGATYAYMFDNLRENRNLLQAGVPLMFGAQFSRYYFLLGAKVYYSILGSYSQKGKYDVTVNDPALLEPYGLGIFDLNGQTGQKIQFKQPDLSVAAEFGIDLDEWLQAQPVQQKKAPKIKPGERLPFGREHIHYRASLFAEYSVLNTNSTPAALPVAYGEDNVQVKSTNTLLAMNGDTKLNNLFVGAKFTIQFEVPGKKPRPVPAPPSYIFYSVLDANTAEPLEVAFIETHNAETGKIVMREKKITPKGLRQKHPLGSYTVEAHMDGYYPAIEDFTIEQVASTQYITLSLLPRPVFRIYVTNAETAQPVPASVQIIEEEANEPSYILTTDSITGTASEILEEGPQYYLHIAQIGYDTLDTVIGYVGDSMSIQLTPVKKGEVFDVKNLHFATNKTRILKSSEEALNDLFMYLERNPKIRIKIIGHTDNVGKDAFNQRLSIGRAIAVMKELIERGIDPDRIEAEGRGESEPIDTNDTEEGRQNNRRVKIEIL